MSLSRRCDIWLATDKQWYMVLGNKEYAYDDHECTTYGPFATEEDVEKELDRHSNPGGSTTDRSGRIPPPTQPKSKPIRRKRK